MCGVCVCVWYSGLDLTWMHRAKEQLCWNVCTLLFNFAPLCLSISAFSAIKKTLHPSLSSRICPSNPAFHPLSHRLPPYPLEPHGLIVLQEAQSRGVWAYVWLCVGVQVCCVIYPADSAWSPALYWDPGRPNNKWHTDMLLSIKSVMVVWVVQYVAHETMNPISWDVDLTSLFILWLILANSL